MTLDALQDRTPVQEAQAARIWDFKVCSGVACCRSFAEHCDVMVAKAVKIQCL